MQFWPRSRRAQFLLLTFANLLVLLGVVWRIEHPLVYILKSRVNAQFAPEPAVEFTFRRVPDSKPVLFSGTGETPMMVMDSCVIGDEEGFHLFFSTVFCETPDGPTMFWTPELGEQFNIAKLITGIAYAFSSDKGLTWRVRSQPVLLPDAEGWDDYRVETASAVIHRNVLHVFYCADRKELPARYQIGEASLALGERTLRAALLDDGEVLQRVRKTPLLAANFERSGFHNNLQEPSALFHDGGFELYFVGLQLSDPANPIGHPGQQLQRVGLGRATFSEALEPKDITPQPLLDFANIVEIKRTDDGLILFTTSGGDGEAHKGEYISYHTSRDGRRWSKGRALLSPRENQFDNWTCMSPTAIRDGDRWIVFYTALEHSNERPPDRWGMSLGNGRWLYSTLGRAESTAIEE
jgi:hypothetical protein